MNDLIINLSVGVFAMCALSVILNNRIKKTISAWVVLIGVVLSALSMLINQAFYSTSFASFAFFAACLAIYMTQKVYARGEI
jgi:Flp pilus assembly protein protease CpaA